MALSNKQKSYIKKHSKKKSARKIASDLNLEIDEVQTYIDEIKKPLSFKKKLLFYAITFSIPVFFFVALEGTLRATNYMGNTNLFIDANIESDEYLVPNPNFASRYFFYTNVIPSPSIDVFLAEKPKDSYRVFAMGGSTAAGYPYSYNGTFSSVVDDVLQDALPQKNVEVVNVGVSAVNTYTLYDQLDEIIEHKPDAIIIYTGHNEFYGALGVGSNENLGGFPGFVRFYLKLQRFKTFLFLRNILVDSGKWISSTFGDGQKKISGTLMERIVASRSIELESAKHKMAMIQFESNLSAILNTFAQKDIPVYISSISSNLKDHAPFVDITDGDQPSAQKTFTDAELEYKNGNYDIALDKYTLAKDLDGLKFRAPSEINTIIKELSSESDNVNYVPVEEAFRENSEHGITGFNLMLEHLHPNKEGYFLIGKTFAKSLLNDLSAEIDQSQSRNDLSNYFDRMYLTYFDDRVEWHRITTLKQGFPFVQSGTQNSYQSNYSPLDFIDSLAFANVHLELGWDRGKVQAAQHYQSIGEFDKAIIEYLGIARNQPWNVSPFIYASRLYLEQGKFDEAEPLLRKAYELTEENAFVTKMLGAIELNRGNIDASIRLLEKSISINPNDPQAIFNLSGAYGRKQQFNKAMELVQKVEKLNPDFPGLQPWKARIQQIIQPRN